MESVDKPRRKKKPKRLSEENMAISRSQIDNLSILTTSYFDAPKSEELEAIRNRLEEMKTEYPLDLLSLVRKQNPSNSIDVLKHKWTRTIQYRDTSISDVTQLVDKMIKEECFQDIIPNHQQAEFAINISCKDELLKTVLRQKEGIFLKYFLNDQIVISLLEKVAQ